MSKFINSLNCQKCGGRVFIDRMFTGAKKKKAKSNDAINDSNTVELACIMCGKRWILNKDKNRLASWLATQEKERNGALSSNR